MFVAGMMAPAAFSAATTERLQATACRGSFEAHLTVDAADLERRATFEALCGELGVKCVLIELAAGVHRSQPMTASYHRGELGAVLGEIEALHASLWQAGFPVVRVKIEAAAMNPGVPITDEEAAAIDGYFEFHAKVRLPDAGDITALRALCESRSAHLSRNDRKRDERGVAERFITQRVYGVGRARAANEFDALLRDLAQAGHAVVSMKREYTIYDGKLELDAGWLDQAPS
jgi:hypothetical protein